MCVFVCVCVCMCVCVCVCMCACVCRGCVGEDGRSSLLGTRLKYFELNRENLSELQCIYFFVYLLVCYYHKGECFDYAVSKHSKTGTRGDLLKTKVLML